MMNKYEHSMTQLIWKAVFFLSIVTVSILAGAVGIRGCHSYRERLLLLKEIEEHKEILKQYPDDAGVMEQLSNRYIAAGMGKEAYQWAKRAVEQKPEDPHLLGTLGTAALLMKSTNNNKNASEGLKIAAEGLLKIAQEQYQHNITDLFLVSHCKLSALCFLEIGNKKQAITAYNLAVNVARQWTKGENPDLRKIGSKELILLVEKDFLGLAEFLEGTVEKGAVPAQHYEQGAVPAL